MPSKNHPGLPRFISAVLTDESRKKLELGLDELKFSNRTLKPEQYMHHVTIAYNPDLSTYEKVIKTVTDGDRIIVKCKRRCWSESFGVEAVTVELKTLNGKDVFINNEYPHITISTEGLPPVKSNDLFKNQYELSDFQFEDVSFLTLESYVEFKD